MVTDSPGPLAVTYEAPVPAYSWGLTQPQPASRVHCGRHQARWRTCSPRGGRPFAPHAVRSRKSVRFFIHATFKLPPAIFARMTFASVEPGLAAVAASLAAHEGEARWFLGDLVVVKLDGTKTGGRLAAIEFTGVRGGEPPMHIHRKEDEVFFLLEGELSLRVGDKTIEMKPGHIALGPKDVPHTYSIRSAQARWLVLAFPAGFENFVREASEAAAELRLPRPGEPQGDESKLGEIAARYGIEFL